LGRAGVSLCESELKPLSLAAACREHASHASPHATQCAPHATRHTELDRL
jgi:hypothetical protein